MKEEGDIEQGIKDAVVAHQVIQHKRQGKSSLECDLLPWFHMKVAAGMDATSALWIRGDGGWVISVAP